MLVGHADRLSLTSFTSYLLSFTAAAVWCSPVPYRLGAGQIWVLVDGQAGPCMGGALHRCMASVHGAGLVGGGVAYYRWHHCLSIHVLGL